MQYQVSARFEMVYMFLYINQAFFKRYIDKSWELFLLLDKDNNKSDLMAVTIIAALKQQNKPDIAFKDFKDALDNPIKYLSSFLNNNPQIINNICDLLDQHHHFVQGLICKWYEAHGSLNQRKDRFKRMEMSKKLRETNKKDILNFLYINAQFFYAPFDHEAEIVNPAFQIWAHQLPHSRDKAALIQFSIILSQILGANSPMPYKRAYGFVPYRTALSSLINGCKEEMEHLLTTDKAIYDVMESIFINKQLDRCIDKWYADHKQQDDRYFRKRIITKKTEKTDVSHFGFFKSGNEKKKTPLLPLEKPIVYRDNADGQHSFKKN